MAGVETRPALEGSGKQHSATIQHTTHYGTGYGRRGSPMLSHARARWHKVTSTRMSVTDPGYHATPLQRREKVATLYVSCHCRFIRLIDAGCSITGIYCCLRYFDSLIEYHASPPIVCRRHDVATGDIRVCLKRQTITCEMLFFACHTATQQYRQEDMPLRDYIAEANTCHMKHIYIYRSFHYYHVSPP